MSLLCWKGHGLPSLGDVTIGKSPLSDNFASNNDADGNHLNEDKSFVVSISGVFFNSCPTLRLREGFFHPHNTVLDPECLSLIGDSNTPVLPGIKSDFFFKDSLFLLMGKSHTNSYAFAHDSYLENGIVVRFFLNNVLKSLNSPRNI